MGEWVGFWCAFAIFLFCWVVIEWVRARLSKRANSTKTNKVLDYRTEMS